MDKQTALTILQEAKELFEPIPDEKWICRDFSSKHGCCALGHWIKAKHKNMPDLPEIELYVAAWELNHSIVSINDGADYHYQQPTPKARVLAFLTDGIAKLQKELAQ